jgi:glycosyltransferase involved in cell wall biosynthesis
VNDPTPLPEVALVHDYFVQDGGAEAVALELARMFPDAPMHTTFFEQDRFGDRIDPDRVRPWSVSSRLRPSPWFRPLLPAYVAHFSRLEVPASRLVLSNSSTFARGVRARRPAIHVAYVHSPLRFAWDADAYLADSSFPLAARLALRAAAPTLRQWDRWAGRRADVVVANSQNDHDRIERRWGRDSRIVHPPVNVAGIEPTTAHDEFYLVATRLLAYKRVEVAIEACQRMGRELVIVGDGPERKRLEALTGRGTRMVGHVNRAALVDLFQRCRGLIVPGIEDFGIAPVEAMAYGKPVVAYARGGVLETVIDGQTGIFFEEATSSSLTRAIEQLEATPIDPARCHARAREFDVAVFRRHWAALLDELGLGDLLVADDGAVAA